MSKVTKQKNNSNNLNNQKDYLIGIVDELKKGNDSVFSEFYELTHRYVYSTIYKNVNNHEVAKDIHQETYVAVYTNIGSLKDSSAVLSWIAKIAYNKTSNHFRKNKHEVLEYEGINIVDEKEESDIALLPDDAMQNKEVQRLLGEIIDELPTMQKLSIISYYYNELNIQETAEALDIPEGTVKTNLYRARKKIKLDVEELASKKDTKLYSASLAPLLLLLLKKNAEAMEIPEELQKATLSKVKDIANASKQINVDKIKGTQSATKPTGKLASTFSSFVANKTAIVAVIAVVATGALGVGVYLNSNNKAEVNNKEIAQEDSTIQTSQPTEEDVSVETSIQTETPTPTPAPTPTSTPTPAPTPMEPIDIPIGSSYTIDLNNDGIEEEVFYDAIYVNENNHTVSEDPIFDISFEINSVDYIEVLKETEDNFGHVFTDEHVGYPDYTFPVADYLTTYQIVDLDTRDNFKEIALTTSYPDIGEKIYLFKYDENLKYIGSLPATGETSFNGDGTITIRNISIVPMTWKILVNYTLNDQGILEYVDEPFYKGEYFEQMAVHSHELLKSIPVFDTPDLTTRHRELPAGTIVKFVSTDNEQWVSIITKDGEEAWFNTEFLNEYDTDEGPVFSNMFYAG